MRIRVAEDAVPRKYQAFHRATVLLFWLPAFFFYGCEARDGASNSGASATLIPDLLADPTGTYTIESVTEPPVASRFRPAAAPHPNLGFSHPALWLRVWIPPSTDRDARLLELGYALLDRVVIFRTQPDGTRQAVTVGDRQPFAEREIQNRNFLFLIPPSKTPQRIYIRVDTEGPMVLPLTL